MGEPGTSHEPTVAPFSHNRMFDQVIYHAPAKIAVMRVSRLKVENFRAIVDTELSLDKLTALIGVNGAGKTSFLLALERFFSDKSGRIKKEDFNDVGESIIITVKFEGVGEEDKCEIRCEWKCETEDAENAGDGKITVTTPQYMWKNKVSGEWEGNTNAKCKAFLKKYVNVIYVPAEHETDDDGEDKKNTLLEKIIDGTVRNIASGEEEEKERRITFQEQFNDKLERVERSLNRKLCGGGGIGSAPNSKVMLRFKDPDLTLETDLKIIDKVNNRNIEHKYVGQGTKRAFYMAALEVRADILMIETKEGDAKKIVKDKNALTLVIIDEPELHQHPQRQRLLLLALQKLSNASHQVVYTTHSSLMVTLKTPMEIRKVVRDSKGVHVHTGDTLKDLPVRGRMIKAMEEAIFASGAIVVEGHTDETIINTILRETNHDGQPIMDTLIKEEAAVVACGGKESMQNFCDVFKSLEIKQFVIWDGDLEKKDGKVKDPKEEAKNNRERAKNARAQNKKIADKIDMKQESLEELETKKDEYVEALGGLCFGIDGPTYLEKHFDVPKGDLERIVKKGEDIGPKFISTGFEDTEFYKSIIRIHDYFAS